MKRRTHDQAFLEALTRLEEPKSGRTHPVCADEGHDWDVSSARQGVSAVQASRSARRVALRVGVAPASSPRASALALRGPAGCDASQAPDAAEVPGRRAQRPFPSRFDGLP